MRDRSGPHLGVGALATEWGRLLLPLPRLCCFKVALPLRLSSIPAAAGRTFLAPLQCFFPLDASIDAFLRHYVFFLRRSWGPGQTGLSLRHERAGSLSDHPLGAACLFPSRVRGPRSARHNYSPADQEQGDVSEVSLLLGSWAVRLLVP